ncbi:MAG: hypothetical protein PVH61_01450 [Candidatus Aminicenantes bacterium]|jgi:hypothetical protein
MTNEILIILVAVVLIAPLLAAQNRGYGSNNENVNEKGRNSHFRF